jgi:1,2-diacylglycerol 3-alpha-glucosyltransferase
VLNNPVDCHYFTPVASPEVKAAIKIRFKIPSQAILYMGRLSYEKSLDQVIQAFALVAKNQPTLQLLLVGDGPEKKTLNQLVQKLSLQHQVIFTGYLFKDDLVKILQAGDIFISASKSENQPTSFLEAMAVGLPIIAANAAGTPEVIQNNINGYLFTPDQTKEFADKIIYLLAKPEKLTEFSLASRRLAQNYSNETVTAKLINYYNGLIKLYEN